MHIKFGFLTHRFVEINQPNRFSEGPLYEEFYCHVTIIYSWSSYSVKNGDHCDMHFVIIPPCMTVEIWAEE